MIEEITIENFKSFKAVTLKLQHVNLLIGPNNSGKSNFLKGIMFWGGQLAHNNYFAKTQPDKYKELSFKKEREECGLVCTYDKNHYIIRSVYSNFFEKKHFKIAHYLDGEHEQMFPLDEIKIEEKRKKIAKFFTGLLIYSPNPLRFNKPSPLVNRSVSIFADCSNMISFLETLRDEYRENFYAIEQDLRKCIPEFRDIRFQTIDPPLQNDEKHYKRWGLFSENSDIIHWADELSEGVLYFVALLCIVHQPEPPKLLLLEEPERGIHPRRIKEVMDFIFQLAEEKDVQIIMTSHNEHVLQEFAETPESVFIFDKDEEGATQVKNLLTDVIEPSNEYSKEHELDKIDFTSNIGENWFEGLMGGVPV